MQIGIDASRALRSLRTGTERYALEIIRHLLALPEAANHQWRLYVDQLSPLSIFIEDALAAERQVQICLLPERRLWTHLALGPELRQNPPDVFFVPAHVLPFALPNETLPPSVVTIHDVGHRFFPEAHTQFQRIYLEVSTRWAIRTATRIIAVSQATAADLQRIYQARPARIAVIHEATVPPKALSSPEPSDLQLRYAMVRPYLLYVGTIQPRKNLHRLVDAYAHLVTTQQVPWDLVLAGGGGHMNQPLLAQAIRHGVGERVHLPGYIPEADLPALYRGALGFCFPSLFEGFGLPVLEAQSYGVPVMAANNSALPEIAGDAALLVDPTDVEAIADAMLQLSSDEALRQRLIQAGYENVNRFSWEKAARETLAVLIAAAEERPRG